MNQGLFTSKTSEWATPPDFFEAIQKEFNLNADVCATHENRKLPAYWTKEDDGLAQDWTGLRAWMNPPYGRQIGKWVKKAATGGADIAVCLLPARTDTKWFHDYIYNKAEIRFIKGRIYFEGGNGARSPAPFPSMLVIFRPEKKEKKEVKKN